MKNNLENSIKDSLREFEMPYDPAAWANLSKKLDQVQPVSPTSNLKWYLGGAASIIIVVATIALWPSDKQGGNSSVIETSENNLDNSVQTQLNNSTEKSTSNNALIVNKNSNSETSASDKKVNSNPDPSDKSNNSEEKKANNNNPFNSPTNFGSGNLNPEKEDLGSGNGEPIKNKEIIVESVANFCQGDLKKLSNKNNVNLIVIDPNDDKTTIPAGKTINFKPELDGKHLIGYMEKGQFIPKESFTVLSSPKVEFEIDDYNKYENGIPSINLSATTPGTSFTWNFEKQQGSVSGKEVKVHYFTKGTYTVSLTQQGSNGCEATATEEVVIEDNYNLMAVNTLDLSSNDNRINMFMPYALTLRSVDFKMIIIDPKDGAIIFETTDATNGWRGIDKRNGQTVESNKTFIWVVQIMNPVKGEKSEYKGTVIKF